MIQANELRIGNLVIKSFDKPCVKIRGIDIKLLSDGIDPYSYTPILLTEKWLIKFGFDKAINGYWDVNEEFRIYEDITGIMFCGSKIPVEIKYVHQLQNLYFSLTGQELQLKK